MQKLTHEEMCEAWDYADIEVTKYIYIPEKPTGVFIGLGLRYIVFGKEADLVRTWYKVMEELYGEDSTDR